MTDIQGLYLINPKTKECVLKCKKPLSFKNIEQITTFLLKKIARKPKHCIIDYTEVLGFAK